MARMTNPKIRDASGVMSASNRRQWAIKKSAQADEGSNPVEVQPTMLQRIAKALGITDEPITADESTTTADQQTAVVTEAVAKGDDVSDAPRTDIKADDYAFVKQGKLLIDNEANVKASLTAFNAVEGVSDEEKDAAWKRLVAAADKYNVGITGNSWRDNPNTEAVKKTGAKMAASRLETLHVHTDAIATGLAGLQALIAELEGADESSEGATEAAEEKQEGEPIAKSDMTIANLTQQLADMTSSYAWQKSYAEQQQAQLTQLQSEISELQGLIVQLQGQSRALEPGTEIQKSATGKNGKDSLIAVLTPMFAAPDED